MINSHSGRSILPFCFVWFVLSCLLYSYWPVLHKLNFQWSKDDNSYCFLVVPVFLYLLWEVKDDFRFGEFCWSLTGIVTAVISVLIIVVGELGSIETLLFLGLWGCAVSIIISMYGLRRSLHLAFPILILLFIVPMPPFINRLLTFEMKMAASTLSVEMMRAVGMTVLQDGNIIDLGISKMQVVDACSGLRYIVSMLLMSLLIGHFFLTGLWRKVLLVLVVYPLSIFINGLRIFIAGLFVVNGYSRFNEGVYHEVQGVVAFLAAGLVLLLLAGVLKKIGPRGRKRKIQDRGCRKARGPVAAFIMTIFLCLLFVGSGWGLKNMSVAMTIPERTTFSSFPMQIGGWQGDRQFLSKEILDSLWADDYVNAIFTHPEFKNVIYVLIPYYEYQGTRHTAHAPQSCLLGGGWALTSNTTRKIAVEPDREIEVGLLTMKKGDMHMLASYFFLQRGRVISSPWWNKFYLMWDAFTRKRTDGALVRVEMTMPPGQELAEAEARLDEFMAKLWPLLSRYVPD